MNRFFFLNFILLFFVFFGSFSVCAQEKNAEEDIAKNYITLLQQGDFSAIESQIHPSLKTADLRKSLERVASFLPKDKPVSIETLGANITDSTTVGEGKTWGADYTFQYEFPGQWFLARVSLIKENEGPLLIRAIHVKPLPDSLETMNRFTFSGKGIVHYLFVAAAISVPLFIIYALVLCIRTPIPRKKWLWIIFVLFGFFGFTLNWTTGAINIQPIYFTLFGSGFFKGPYTPLLIKTSIPVGAMIFLFKRRKWLANPSHKPAKKQER